MSERISMAKIVKTKLIMAHLPWTQKRFLKFNVYLLELCGYKMDRKFWSSTQYALAFTQQVLVLAIALCGVFYNVYDIASNISVGRVVQGIQAMSLPCISFTSVIAHIHFLIFKTDLETLMGQIDDMVKVALSISPKISSPLLDKYSFVSNSVLLFFILSLPFAVMSNLQIPLLHVIQHGASTNYSEIPMSFELYYGTKPRESPTVFWMIALLQNIQMMLSLAYFIPVLSCYLSIVYFLQSMNEITNLYFEYFYLCPEDDCNPFNDQKIPFRGVLGLHQKLLKAMEFYATIISSLIFVAFSMGVIFLAISFFEIVMYGFDPQNSKAAFLISMALIVTFSIMWFFQTISELTSRPLEILYFRPWYRVIHKQQLLSNIKFAMTRTTKEVKYTLGGLSTRATMDTFLSLLKSAFSYSSILNATKEV